MTQKLMSRGRVIERGVPVNYIHVWNYNENGLRRRLVRKLGLLDLKHLKEK